MNWQFLADLAFTFDSTNAVFKPNRIKARHLHEVVEQVNKINAIKIKVNPTTYNTQMPRPKKIVKRKSAWSAVSSVL